MFNDNFSTDSLYRATSAKEFNPMAITHLLQTDGRILKIRTPVLPLSKQVLYRLNFPSLASDALLTVHMHSHADDIVLVAQSACAIRKMLAVCNEYASDFLSFNAQKSECMVMLPNSRSFLVK